MLTPASPRRCDGSIARHRSAARNSTKADLTLEDLNWTLISSGSVSQSDGFTPPLYYEVERDGTILDDTPVASCRHPYMLLEWVI
jgi:hypothetical protein